MSVSSVLARGETFHLASLLPGERLFRGLSRWDVGDAHRQRLRVLGLPHHHVHDARHFYAIRAVQAGTPYELVARQFGHTDIAIVAKVYGRFAPAFRRTRPLEADRGCAGREIDPDGYRGGYGAGGP